jgi:acetate kinase
MTQPRPAEHARVLVLNCGSSSVKFALVDPETGNRAVSGLGERIGSSEAAVHVRRGGHEQSSSPSDHSYGGVLAHLISSLAAEECQGLIGVGHRVVHGGTRYSAAVAIDDTVLDGLRELSNLAPLHMPANIAGIEAARSALPDAMQVAVFDTAFHQTMPEVAYRYAVPDDWYRDHHVRRYGFHGTSHRYISARAAEQLGRPYESLCMVTLHLGNGCSAAAIRDGKSIDTTMGLTPLEGLVMGTRSGDIDAGALDYIGRQLDLDLAAVVNRLNTASGLLGLSGLSNDMRTLCDAARQGSAAASLAIDVFCYRAAKAVGALAVALGGLDVVVFSGGIGERSPEVRAAIMERLGLLGIVEDAAANLDHGRSTNGRISAAGHEPVVLVVATDEELVIARDTAGLAR